MNAFRWAIALAAVLLVACSAAVAGLPSLPLGDLPAAGTTAPPVPASAAESDCAGATAAALWSAALEACQRADRESPGNPTTTANLGAAYLGLGRGALDVGDVAAAVNWFEKARVAMPASRQAAREYALAVAYRAGEAALAAGDWEEGIAKYRGVFEGDRLYMSWLPDASARRMLAEASLEGSRALIASGDLERAEQLCRDASTLLPELEHAQKCMADVIKARTPTPTPSPTPAPTRTPGPGARSIAPALVPQRPYVVPARPSGAPPTPDRPAAPTLSGGPPPAATPAVATPQRQNVQQPAPAQQAAPTPPRSNPAIPTLGVRVP